MYECQSKPKIRINLESPDGNIFVVLASAATATFKRDYLNFGYKDMDETMVPGECDCPKSIIALLTPTDNEYALLWRKRCLDTHSSKAHLAKLPIGAVIEFSRNGKTVRLEKHEAA